MFSKDLMHMTSRNRKGALGRGSLCEYTLHQHKCKQLICVPIRYTSKSTTRAHCKKCLQTVVELKKKKQRNTKRKQKERCQFLETHWQHFSAFCKYFFLFFFCFKSTEFFYSVCEVFIVRTVCFIVCPLKWRHVSSGPVRCVKHFTSVI